MKKIKIVQMFAFWVLMGFIFPIQASGGLYTKKATVLEEGHHLRKVTTDEYDPNDEGDTNLNGRSPLKGPGYFFLLMGISYALVKGRSKTRRQH